RVPAGTQSGQVFQLRGRGLPRVNASGAGDLHVRVQLWTPQSVSPEHSTVLQELQTLEGNVPAGNTRAKGLWSKMKEALGA
ncbi:MAG TPA: DnaJ C-terminal domain-containing protein, partial [Gemmatimonadaceae bacterium]|nr:DnaJ C-terminal domain-containing protein [Gemmatimonadaceae bacterium]